MNWLSKIERTVVGIAACATLLWAGTVLAAFVPSAQQKCDNARITAWKVYTSCVDGVVAKDAKGVVFDKFAAFAKCRHAYFKKWPAFQPKASLAGSTCIGNRFTDNFDESATDNLTGLTWERKDNGGGAHDWTYSFTWSTGSPYREHGSAFTDFLGTLNGGGGFAGATGWRLPTLAELQTIVLDFPCTGLGGVNGCACHSLPCVDSDVNSNFTQAGTYWSATGYVPGPGSAWVVYFDVGGLGTDTKTDFDYVRAVRGGL